MKRLQSTGIGSKQKQAEPLTRKDVEILWEKKLLGDSTLQSLLDTIVFFNGLYFALRSGKEHRQLRYHPPQIKVVENPGERPYLIYIEDSSKNHLEGIKGRKQKPKVVVQHANVEQPERCFVRLKLYNSLCPKEHSTECLYLQPLTKPREGCWYSSPYGHAYVQMQEYQGIKQTILFELQMPPGFLILMLMSDSSWKGRVILAVKV